MARARPSPLFPVAQPDASSEPPVQFDHFGIALAVAEVVVSSSDDVRLESFDARCHAAPVAPVGDVTDPLLEPFDGGICPVELAPSQLEAEERTRTQACGPTLAWVDAQTQAPLDESADAAQYTPRRLLAAHEDQEVVGVARIAVHASSNSTSRSSSITLASQGRADRLAAHRRGLALDCRQVG